MRYYTLLPAVVSLGVLGACTEQQTSPIATTDVAASLAAAVTPATRTEFEGFICFGPGAVDEFIPTPGGPFRLKAHDENRWVTGNPLIDGVEHILVDAKINPINGSGSLEIASSLKPDAVNGTWEIRQTVTLNGAAGVFSRGVGQGTGDLSGMTIQFFADPAAPIPSGCESGFGPQLHGVIISPATSG